MRAVAASSSAVLTLCVVLGPTKEEEEEEWHLSFKVQKALFQLWYFTHNGNDYGVH